VLGGILSLFGAIRWLKATLAGRPTETGGFNHYEFREFINGKPVQRPTQKASKKLLILFLLVVVGIPYAVTKLMKVLQERAVASGGALPGRLPPLDPASLTFVRVKYACTPSNPNELELKGDEIVAVMGKLDQRTGAEVDPRLEVEGEWWRGRTRQGGGSSRKSGLKFWTGGNLRNLKRSVRRIWMFHFCTNVRLFLASGHIHSFIILLSIGLLFLSGLFLL
jgi:peroxin-13